ncbi:hypothetical protein [Rubidibacter lacunae]|uniref:hypothetical protein n=1 Tax=Rubidibacter lacunae TaxID=582514 RepID=UPI0012EB6FF9|nr:hypothetical protein [Rubidibacter lacunae]
MNIACQFSSETSRARAVTWRLAKRQSDRTAPFLAPQRGIAIVLGLLGVAQPEYQHPFSLDIDYIKVAIASYLNRH